MVSVPTKDTIPRYFRSPPIVSSLMSTLVLAAGCVSAVRTAQKQEGWNAFFYLSASLSSALSVFLRSVLLPDGVYRNSYCQQYRWQATNPFLECICTATGTVCPSPSTNVYVAHRLAVLLSHTRAVCFLPMFFMIPRLPFPNEAACHHLHTSIGADTCENLVSLFLVSPVVFHEFNLFQVSNE